MVIFFLDCKLLVERNTSLENMDVTATGNKTDMQIQAPVDECHLNSCKFY